jgi:hypothetical protein
VTLLSLVSLAVSSVRRTAGVELIDENGGGPGARLRKKVAAEVRLRARFGTRRVLLPVRPVQVILLASYFTMRAQDYGAYRKTDDNAFDQRTGDSAKVDPAAAALGRRYAPSCVI